MRKQASGNDRADAKQRLPGPAFHGMTTTEPEIRSNVNIQPASLDPYTTRPHHVLQYQNTVGNRAIAILLSVQRDTLGAATVTPTSTKPRLVNIPIGPQGAIVFQTPKMTVGDVDVYVTGRMAIKGMASLSAEDLPAKGADAALRTRVHSMFKDTLNAAKLIGTAMKIEMPVGNETLALELGEGAARSPAFQVSGHFYAEGRDLRVPDCEIKGATVILDATAWISPSKLPPAPSPAQPGAVPVPGDSNVKRFAFAGNEAQFKDQEAKGRKRSGGVTLKSAMDAFEAKVPTEVKNHSFLQLPEQRAAFFQHMRAYFGTDEKTIEHFSKMRLAKVKGATTWLHEDAATRLEKVQEEIGEANMPVSGGVGWPRSECALATKQDTTNFHNIGWAVDYNAYQTPHLTDYRILDLIQIVTGRSATANYGSPAGLDSRSIGETFTTGTPDDKKKLEDDPKIQKWLEQVGNEVEALSKASEDFRASLKTTEKGIQVDHAPKLQELRQKWFEAKTQSDKQAILAELQTIIEPWLVKVAAQKLAVETKIQQVGLDPAKLPAAENLETAIAAAQRLSKSMETLLSKLSTEFKKGQRAHVDNLIVQARKLLEEVGNTPTDESTALAELRRLATLVDKRQTGLVRKKWLDRVNALLAALTGNASFVFGKGPNKEVGNPALAQLVDLGFFTTSKTPKAGPQAFDANFVKNMVKHGFMHGATWSTPDLMHFELRREGPGKK